MIVAALLLVAQTRMASDFEIAQMKQQIARSRDFVSQLSGHLNLGDLYRTRSETATTREEYAKALEIASNERQSARKAADMTRYATATAYTALADAKLGNAADAFDAAEEAIRYTSGSAKSWNLYATAMSLVGRDAKAIRASRNAVAIAERGGNTLDLAVYRYTLASALGDSPEAAQLLRTITTSLRSEEFASLRRSIARSESFEIYSTARGDEQAYLSLLNRAGLRLARLLEVRGDTAGAQREYERVLETRSDDPTALTALARYSPKYFDAAFEANPFSMTLVREYQKYLETEGRRDGGTTPMQKALVAMRSGEMRAARDMLDSLLQKFPGNETLQTLRREMDPSADVPAFLTTGGTNLTPPASELRQLMAVMNKLSPEERATLDRTTFAPSITTAGVPFRVSQPGPAAAYRILGVTDVNGADALLLEPLP
ncbi:MAG TPA: hypothetical protein VLU46_02830 [Thermoanaerobaculia bacterium]|nr:hypothetical protein [Thermoanaerobaculia bacterium]